MMIMVNTDSVMKKVIRTWATTYPMLEAVKNGEMFNLLPLFCNFA